MAFTFYLCTSHFSVTTGTKWQIIVHRLRPSSSHSNNWHVAILKRMVKKIREAHPKINSTALGDADFSCAPFYDLADQVNLKCTLGGLK